MSLDKQLSHYCAISRDEMNMEAQCSEQAKQFTEEITKCKTLMADFLEQQKKTCIPITIRTANGEEKTIYLRNVEKTTYKTVNEDAFKRVIETVPTPDELKDVYDQLENPAASFIDVYSAWIYNTLYDQNTSKRTTFEISDKKERTKKSKTADEIKVPSHIIQAAEDWVNTTYNIKRLKTFKKTAMTQLADEKKVIEPAIETFLASKPPEKQEQKISMVVQGHEKPFYLKRVIEKKRPALTLTKSKPIILQTVQTMVQSTNPTLLKKPFTTEDAKNVFSNEIVLNVLFDEFRTKLASFKQAGTKVTTHIEMSDKPTGKRKRHADDDEDEVDEENQEEESE